MDLAANAPVKAIKTTARKVICHFCRRSTLRNDPLGTCPTIIKTVSVKSSLMESRL